MINMAGRRYGMTGIVHCEQARRGAPSVLSFQPLTSLNRISFFFILENVHCFFCEKKFLGINYQKVTCRFLEDILKKQ
jgi:hypothetical protein